VVGRIADEYRVPSRSTVYERLIAGIHAAREVERAKEAAWADITKISQPGRESN